MRHHALDERHAFAETLRSTGPGAPTLCGEWSTAQLAAHLVLRERSLVELAGRAPVEAWRKRAEGRIDELVATRPYGQLVADFERGPARTQLPVGFVWALPPVREAANLLEYLVHHEDVRRAAESWSPRPLPVDVQMAVWKRLPTAARLTLRKVSVGLELAWPGHGSFRARGRAGSPAVRISGEPVELALFAFGRAGVARVEYDGDPEQIALVRGAEIRI
jgi:uncharacterized protein (TIGR03085 family)